MYKLFVFAPDDRQLIFDIIEAAAKVGAGIIGKYSRCAFISRGTATWKAEEGANPVVGKIGEFIQQPHVRIEMRCPDNKRAEVEQLIRALHPFEEFEVDFVKLEKAK
ncbi:MAG: hypothetical protein AUJ41_04085 [Candidatus Pacebacteria bacterium CG1_02_43_31]|nr:MAG: hypothetical protein AUJ41_04085 [Candidatus Pacebacteria bacterium CG1_02_43_31]